MSRRNGRGETGGLTALHPHKKGRPLKNWTAARPDDEIVQSDDRVNGNQEVPPKKCQPYILGKTEGDLLKVSRVLRFGQSNVEGIFEAKIRIQNVSSWNIAYCVRSSSVEKFSMKRKTGWISQNSQIDVIVMSRLQPEQDFGDLCSEGFVVFGTPVYFASQLDDRKIRLLWKMYGSEAFPFEAAEAYKIDQLIPGRDSYMDNYNIIERAALGNYVSGTYNMHVECPDKAVDDATFYENWRPTETQYEALDQLKTQVEKWRMTLRALKDKTEGWLVTSKYAVAFVTTAVVTLAILNYGETFRFPGRDIGPNGNIWGAAPEPKPWWKFF